ncbi:MAG: metalloprotease PmbA [Gammaproteobacteria bacterium]
MDALNERQSQTDLIEQLLTLCRQQGADAAEASIDSGHGLAVTVRMGQVETIEHQRDKGLGVTVYRGRRKGSASSSDFSAAALKETVTAACTIAAQASEDECAGLIEAACLATDIPDLDLYHPWEPTPDQAIDMATECENTARGQDKRITNSEGVLVSTYSGSHLYGNSHGFSGGWDWSSHNIECTLIAEQDGLMQAGNWYSRARDRNDLQAIDAVGRQAAERTLSRLGARKLGTRQAPVIFEAPVASSLFAALINAISGGALYRKATFLLDKLGEQIFPDDMQIHEQPFLKKAQGSAPFDNDGMATGNKHFVRDGILQGYVLSAYSARKLGLQPTGNAGGVHNLTVETGNDTLSDLIKQMHTGLLITELIGFGVNQVTGDYSRGASGFWVEGGEVQYPVEEITVAGNLTEMFRQITAVGGDVDRRRNIRTGSVLVENMTIAGE